MGCGVVVVVVVWVDWRRSVARFVDISGLRLGSSASVSRGWVRRYQWVARVGFVVVGVVVAWWVWWVWAWFIYLFFLLWAVIVVVVVVVGVG